MFEIINTLYLKSLCVNKEIYYQKVSVKYVILKELIIAKEGDVLSNKTIHLHINNVISNQI